MKKTAWLLLTVVLVAGGEGRAGLPRPYGGQIRMQVDEGDLLLDPARACEFADLLLARQVHQPLLRWEGADTLRPLLLVREPQPSEDRREWVLELQPQLLDQRGLSIGGRELIDSWLRLLDPATASPHWWLLAPVAGAMEYARGQKTQVSGLVLEHPLKVVVTLRYALSEYEQVLGALPLAPLSTAARTLTAAGRIGSGPFLVVEGASRLSCFSQAPAGRPYLEAIDLIPMASEREAQMAFAAGRLQLVQAPAGADSQASPAVWPVFLAFPSSLPDRLPPGLRPALEAALDRRSLAAMAAAWGAEPLYGLLEGAEEERQPDAAALIQSYLEKVSWAQRGLPLSLRLLVRRGDALERVLGEKVQLQLARLGLVLSLEEVDRRELNSRLPPADDCFYFVRPFLPARHPFLRLLGTVAYLAGDRPAALRLVEELQQRWQQLSADQCQEKLCPELERAFRSRVPAVALVRHSYAFRVSTTVADFGWGGDGLPDLTGIWLQKE